MRVLSSICFKDNPMPETAYEKLLVGERNERIAKVQKFYSDASKDSRRLTDEERTEVDNLEAAIEKDQEEIKRYQESEAARASQDLRGERIERERYEYGRDDRAITQEDRALAFRAWSMPKECSTRQREAAGKCGIDLNAKTLDLKLPSVPMGMDEARRRARNLEYRATTAQSSTAGAKGGNLTHTELVTSIEVALKAYGGMRQVSRVVRNSNGEALLFPTLDDTGNVGQIVGQNSAVTVDDMALGQVSIGTFRYTSNMVKVSLELLQDEQVSLISEIGRSLGERVARITNTHFSNSTGGTKPDGVQNKAPAGFTVTTTNSTGQITYKTLKECEFALDPAYRANASWQMHDNILLEVHKLVDANGLPIFRPGVGIGDPGSIFGYPVTVNQDLTSVTTGRGNKLALFGDFQSYIIRDVMDMQLVRLDERYAENGQVAWFTFSRHGGGTVFGSTTNANKPIQALAGLATTGESF